MSSLPTFNVSSPDYQDSVRAALEALGAEPSFPLPESQLALSTLDGLCEVLEWNNQGQAADEIACIWLASLRWYTRAGYLLSASHPRSLPRPFGTAMPQHTGAAADSATISGLALSDMQLIDRNEQKDADGAGALLRASTVALLPVQEDQTVAVIAAKVAALTHGASQAIVGAAALAVLARAALAYRDNSTAPLTEALAYAQDWAEKIEENSALPGDGKDVQEALTGVSQSQSPALTALAQVVEALKTYEESKTRSDLPETPEQTLVFALVQLIIGCAYGREAIGTHLHEKAEKPVRILQKQWFKELGIA